MPNVISPTLMARYLEELSRDEEIVGEAADVYEDAKASVDVGLRRYIALRDFITEQSGESPYAKGRWTQGRNTGRFRFAGMSVGDALLNVLREEAELHPQNSWLSLGMIVDRLSHGGLGYPEGVQMRAVNAALMKTAGVLRSQDPETRVTVYAIGTEYDPDDLPFEP